MGVARTFQHILKYALVQGTKRNYCHVQNTYIPTCNISSKSPVLGYQLALYVIFFKSMINPSCIENLNQDTFGIRTDRLLNIIVILNIFLNARCIP